MLVPHSSTPLLVPPRYFVGVPQNSGQRHLLLAARLSSRVRSNSRFETSIPSYARIQTPSQGKTTQALAPGLSRSGDLCLYTHIVTPAFPCHIPYSILGLPDPLLDPDPPPQSSYIHESDSINELKSSVLRSACPQKVEPVVLQQVDKPVLPNFR